MTFSSYVFILAFLPLFLLLYFTVGKMSLKIRKILMILGGMIFFLHAGWESAAVLGASLLMNFLLARMITGTQRPRGMLGLTIAANVGVLFYFKYSNFALEMIQSVTRGTFSFREILLPLGISFFTFQQIMYVSSVGKGEIRVKLPDYLAYILFFPKLIMGPLMEPAEFIRQINDPERKNISWENMASGLKLFSFGLCKKMLLADTFAKAVAWGFANGTATAGKLPMATSYDLLLVMLSYTFQIYFDFSGYSDMATGVSKMLNIDLPINFDSPYKAASLRDFWRRWHVTLSGFLTKYIYIPLGGNRKGSARTCANIMIVFLISGLWHGASWTFVLWGFLHGLLQVLERCFSKTLRKLPGFIRWGYTFFFVNILWLLFRAESIREWLDLLKRTFSLRYRLISDGLLQTFELPITRFLFEKIHLTQLYTGVRGFSMILFLISALLICLIPQNNYRSMRKTNMLQLVLSVIFFVCGFLSISSESVFVYFNF